MTKVLIWKLLRDVRFALIVVAFLLGAFQCLWAIVTSRILGELAPFFQGMASELYGDPRLVEQIVFAGPGKVIRTLIGGEQINLDGAMDLLSIGYVHPLVQTILCIWAIGRAAGAIAGEIDRGTMELLMSQPLARTKLIGAHLVVDLITIPLVCLSLWAGNAIGAWLITPINPKPPEEVGLPIETQPGVDVRMKGRLEIPFAPVEYDVRAKTQSTIKIDVKGGVKTPLGERNVDAKHYVDLPSPQPSGAQKKDRLKVRPWRFGRALWVVGGLLFAVCGVTMWISSMGRSRWRVLGLTIFLTLIMFLVNLIGQMWEVMEPLRPLTIFYYYQPQQAILNQGWSVTFKEWNGGDELCRLPMLAVLYGVGIVGYSLAWWTFCKRDLPAPL